MKYKFKIEIGDPSKDGHNQSEDRIIESNKTIEEVREAYDKSCLLTGLVFTSNKDIIVNNEKLGWQHLEYSDRSVCTEYESWNISELAQNILKDNNIEVFDDEQDIDSLTNIFLEFIKLSLPDFEYEIIQNIIPSLNLTIGYGLFD